MAGIPNELLVEIAGAEKALADLGRRELCLWEQVKIDPGRWQQNQYVGEGPVWVIAVMGHACLYFNEVEVGWGWGRFEAWGTVSEYHCQQDEIQHSIHQMLCVIDETR